MRFEMHFVLDSKLAKLFSEVPPPRLSKGSASFISTAALALV